MEMPVGSVTPTMHLRRGMPHRFEDVHDKEAWRLLIEAMSLLYDKSAVDAPWQPHDETLYPSQHSKAQSMSRPLLKETAGCPAYDTHSSLTAS